MNSGTPAGGASWNRPVAEFLAVVLNALALVPTGAHVLALPNKIGLDEEAYFTVQTIYRGWALLGIVLFAAIVANLVLTVRLRRARWPFVFALSATVWLLASLAVFFVWVFPANQATDDWTIAPENWQTLRTHWEYGHAAGAALDFLALCAVTLAALTARRRRRHP